MLKNDDRAYMANLELRRHLVYASYPAPLTVHLSYTDKCVCVCVCDHNPAQMVHDSDICIKLLRLKFLKIRQFLVRFAIE